MRVIYSRVSTNKQECENQLSRLKELYPEAAVFEEVASGAKSRPILQTLLASLNKGDTLIVAALDRLGRKTAEILNLIEDLDKRGIVLVSVREGVDYSSICGKLVTQILVSVAEMERNLISERTKHALAAKRAQGIVGGRKAIYTKEVVEEAKRLKSTGQTCKVIAAQLGMSASRVSQLTKKTA